MAKKTKADAVPFDIINGNFDDHDGYDIEVSLQAKLREQVSGVSVNGTNMEKNNGVVNIVLPPIPTVSADVNNTSNPNAAQAGAVAQELNGIKSNLIHNARQGAVSPDGSEVALEFLDSENDVLFSVDIPAAQDVGEVIYPVITATRITPARMKLGDSVRISWQYDCLSNQQQGSVTEYPGTVSVKVTLQNDSGTTTLVNQTIGTGIVPGSTAQLLVIDGANISTSGTLKVIFTATAEIDGEVKTVQRTVTVTIVSLSLSSSFNPSTGLAANGGYIDGETVTIPYSYSVPAGTSLKVWLNGTLRDTVAISGTSNSTMQIPVSALSVGRNNVQLLAVDDQGLLSNVVSIDMRKAGNNSDFLGFVMAVSSDGIENVSIDMPLPYAYNNSGMGLDVAQFSTIDLVFAVWNNASTQSTVIVAIDGNVTQTISVGRTQQTLSQRFDDTGSHTLTITMGTCVWLLSVTVIATGNVTETVVSGAVKALSAVGRNNSLADREEWGGVTTFTGLNFSSNGWIEDTLLLTNGATAFIDLKPFADYSSDGNGIHQIGMTVEVELMVSQVVERGSTILHCLWDNTQNKAYDPTDASSYPRGIKVATDKAGLLFGGPEEIHTAEKVQDSEGNYLRFSAATVSVGDDISSAGYYVKVSNNVWELTTDTIAVSGTTYYEGIVCSENDAQDLFVIRPFGAEMNIAENKWMHLAFVIQPVAGTTYLLGMLYINGVLSRVNRLDNSAITASDMVQGTPVGITIDSDKADVRVRTIRYYRTALDRDQILSNYIATLHTAAEMQVVHDRNDVGGVDTNNQATISRTALIETKKRGVLTIVKSHKKLNNTVNSDLSELFENGVGKKEDFWADYIRWDPPCDAQGNKIGEGFEAWNVNIRIQGTSSVNYPYKNIRIYLAKTNFHSNDNPARIKVGGKTYVYNSSSKKMVWTDPLDSTHTENFSGYCLRGSSGSLPQAVLCAKTDFVDSSLVMNTGGAHLFNDKMHALGLDTPPMEHDARVRQAIDGIPCDLYAGTSESGPFIYYGQFVLNNEKSKSDKIFGMTGVSGFSPICPIALEALENRYALTLFQSAGQSSDSITIGETTTSFSGSSAENTSLENQLSNTFDSAFEFNYPEDTFWTQEKANDEGGSVASDLRKNAIRRLMSFIYRSVKESNVNMSNPEYGDQNGWSATDKAKWQSAYFRAHVAEYFDVDYLCTYYLFTDYWASVDQRAKNILWRTWDGLKWYPTYYDGDTAMSIRNDAFMVYLYSVTRDTYDTERSKYAFEGHDSWLWCLLLANVEYGNAQTNPIYDRLATCARAFRNQVSLDAMLTEFNTNMMWNWSERQYNYSQKLKYIDTMDVKYYPYTLTGNREAHRTQFLTERSALLDAQYTAGDYLTDTFVIFANREANEDPNTIVIKSGDLYYFGFRDVQNNWVVRPQRASAGDLVTLTISQALAGTSGSSNVTGASKIRELDLTGMRSNITGSGVNLSSCVILEKLVFTATGNYRFGGTLQLGQTSKLQYIELTGQTGINDGQTGRLNLSYHTRLGTVLLSGTGLETLILPEGAPITTLSLPKTLGVLTLRNLPLLTMANLTMEDNVWTGFLGFNFSNCPNLSWTELLNRCTNAKRVRIEGLGGRIHSSQIIKFMEGWNPNNPTDSSNLVYHGLNANGTNNNWPQFGGSVVKLIDLVDTVTVGGVIYTAEQMKSFFEKCELTLLDPQYSVYEIDDTLTVDDGNGNLVLTSACVKNLENNSMASDVTGTGYVASGHAVRVRDKMKPVWGKLVTEGENVGKWVGVEMSGSGYGKYKNGSDISNYKTDEEGNDAMMLLPHCWYKGVNDFVHQKKYIIWSSVENGTDLNGESIPPQSSATNTTRKKLSELVKQTGAYVNWSGIEEGSTTIEEAIVIDGNVDLDVYRIDVEGMKQVRWPGAIKHSTYGACFMNADGIVVKRFRLNVQDADFDYQRREGDYIFTDVPPDAKTFVFSCDSAANANWEVIAVDSDEIEAIEPDWVEHKECLVGIYQASLHRVAFSSGSNPNQLLPKGLRSISGATVTRGSVYSDSSTHSGWESEDLYDATTGNPTGWPTTNSFKMSMKDFQNIARLRGAGYQLVDYEMSKFVAILFYCLTGTLNSQEVCGDGCYLTTTGTWDAIGNRSTSALEFATYTSRTNKCLGLENWFGCVYEWCDNVGVNITSYIQFYKNHMVATGSSNGRWWIYDPDSGTERYVKGQMENTSSTGGYIKRVRHGRFCDLVPIVVHGTSTSRYADWYTYTTTSNRVLGRSHYSGSANAGVAYAHANHASSVSHTNGGSRLAFRGDIVLQEP